MIELGIIIQARMGSSRLPGKILKRIGAKTLLEHIFFRMSFLQHDAMIIVATSDSPRDDIVEKFCINRNVPCFRGNESNVLERYYLCAKKYGFQQIVRLTGDNPFVDTEEVDRLIDLHLKSGSEYANSLRSLPVGVGAEIFTFAALEKMRREGKAPKHIEHVTEYILENPALFKMTFLKTMPDKDRYDVRLTIDTEEDYSMACFIIDNVCSEHATTQEVIRLAEEYVLKRPA